MISFNEGQSLISEHPIPLDNVDIDVRDALLRVVAVDVFAPIDLPPFDNSAVDGYAVLSNSLQKSFSLPVIKTMRAEKQFPQALPPNMAISIMTGAPLPTGADAVAMKEDVVLLNGYAHFEKPIIPKDNVRYRGEDIERGAQVLSAGTVVTPSIIGLLCGLGIERIKVFRAPSIRIISTGDELQQAGQPLNFGQVYYLMGPMLKAQCQAFSLHDVAYDIVADDTLAIIQAINRFADADIILLTGGMSQGDYDLVRSALHCCQVEDIFYRGAWRPGKPLYFGKRGNTRIFGLPGNPVAAFVSFHAFVRPLIHASMRRGREALRSAVAKNDLVKKPGITFFARAKVNEDNELAFLTGQGSHQIMSLSQANGLCLVPEDQAIVKTGEIVNYYAIG